MRKFIILFLIFGVMVSLCMCIDSTWKHLTSVENNRSENTYVVNLTIEGQPIQLVLRTTVREALSTELINTNDSDIVKSYLSHKIIYIEYNKSLPLEEGKLSVIDLSLKLGFLNPLYRHVIVDDSVFKNESEKEKVINSNITLILKVIRGNRSATIEKVDNRTYIIEGNSLKELDKAVSRFVLAIYKGVAEKS
ncbi:MAG TPA: hypothetical protein EYG77_00370 [Methanothermococcus okinawensis]|nr:hypothetical protein [Methanothermococcus okinawensis]